MIGACNLTTANETRDLMRMGYCAECILKRWKREPFRTHVFTNPYNGPNTQPRSIKYEANGPLNFAIIDI